MDSARLIAAIFRDKPGVIYENPPPPSDYKDDFESVFFIYPGPQSVKFLPEKRFIEIDRSLIHKSLLGCEKKEGEQTSTESTRGNENGTSNENIEGLKTDKIEESCAEVSVNKIALEKGIHKKKKKERKQRNRPKEERKNDIDSDDSKKSKKKNVLVPESSALESISKSYSMSESDSDDIEKQTKSSSHHAKSHSKKSSRHKRKHKDSRKDSSYTDVVPYDRVGLRSAEISVKQEICSSDEETFSSSFSKKVEITIKEEELSDEDNYRKDKIKSSKSSKKKSDSRSHVDSRNRFDESRNHDDARIHNEESFSSSFSKKAELAVKEEALYDKDDFRKDKIKSSKSSKKKYGSRSSEDSRSSDDSRSRCDSRNHGNSRNRFVDSRSHNDTRNRFDDSWSRDDVRTRDDRRKNHSDYSSDDDSRKKHYDDSNGSSRNFNSYMQREMKQEIKQEPGSASYYGSNDYYCDVCKLILNSETTFSSHMAGKKHKKALRQLSEQEVAKSSVLEITEFQNFPRPPDMDRIELYEEESKIQETCENADLLIVGLDYVQEIRGYDDTKYFCDLCGAQCVANSIIKHLIGIKHQMNCLKTYCYRSYSWIKDLEKRDRRVERELKSQLERAQRIHGKGRIRVFKDVKRSKRSPEHFNPHQPSTSRQLLFPGDVQGKKVDEQKVTDEECLSRDYSDFYCKVCDSHMNNYAMWESHARGKRHAKNKKKAEEGGGMNSNFIEAPRGTISHLEEMIIEQCDPSDIIVGLNFIRENRGENGDLYNCFLCGSVCTTIDIIDHLYLKKHKTKYLEKMASDGHHNAINEINSLPIGESAREGLVDDECIMMLKNYGRGKVVIALTKTCSP